MNVKFRLRRDTAANWTSANPILASGEPAYVTDTGEFKIGDGTTEWVSLPNVATSGDVSSLTGMINDLDDSLTQSIADLTTTVTDNNNGAVHKDDLEINVKDHGALGDGTADDTSALNTSFALGASTGRPVFIPSGTYMTSGLVASASVRVRAAKGAVLKKASTATAAALTISGASVFVEIDGLEVDGNRAAGATNHNIIVDTGAFATLRNMNVHHSKGQGIRVQAASTKCYCYNVTSNDNDGGSGTAGNGDGWLVQTGAYLWMADDCSAYRNVRAGVFVLEGAADGCRVGGYTNRNALAGFVLRSNNGYGGMLVCEDNDKYGVQIGKSSPAGATTGWDIASIYTRNQGITAVNGAATGLECFGAQHCRFGHIVNDGDKGYGTALAANNTAPVAASSYNTIGTHVSKSLGDPGLHFSGGSSHNHVAITTGMNLGSLAVIMGEGTTGNDYNTVETVVAEGCQYGAVRIDGGANNTIGRVTSRDTYTLDATYKGVVSFVTAASAGNRVKYLEHSTPGGGTKPGYAAWFGTGTANNIVETFKIVPGDLATSPLSDAGTANALGLGTVNVKWFNAKGDGTTDDTAAFAAALTTGLPVYIPAGTYVVATPLTANLTQPVFIGDGITDSIIKPTTYFIDTTSAFGSMNIQKIKFQGGTGVIRSTYSGVNVAQPKVIRDCWFKDYTLAAVSSNATDEPYWQIDRCQFDALTETSSIGVALAGSQDGSLISGCSFLRNRIDIKLRKAATVRIDSCDFVPYGTGDGTNPRAGIWFVPGTTTRGAVVQKCKFGNENIQAIDYHVIVADDSAAGDVGASFPNLAADSTATMSGCHFREIDVQGATGAHPPLIYSTTPNLQGNTFGPLAVVGSVPDYIIQFRSALAPSRLNQDNVVGPVVGLDVLDTENRSLLAPANYPGAVKVIDPNNMFSGYPEQPYPATGGSDTTGYAELLSLGINSFTMNAATKTQTTDAAGGTDAAEIEFTTSSGFANGALVTANIKPGRPAWIEFDVAAPLSGTAMTRIAARLDYTSNGAIHWRKNITVPGAADGWVRYRFPFTPREATTTILMRFTEIVSSTETHPSRFRVGRVRIYHAREPIPVREQDRPDILPTDRTYYVATWGSDSYDGLSSDRPFKTIAKAFTKQPAVTQTTGSTLRSTKIVIAPGDYHETSPLVWKKGSNLELVGTGGRGAGGLNIYGGTNIFTPVGQVGLTLGYRNDTDTSWLNAKSGYIVRNIDIRPDGTDTGGTTGILVIGMSNCSFYDVALADFVGAGSIGWDFVSNNVANGGSGGATMYNSLYDCTVSGTMTGIRLQSCGVTLNGCLIDGTNDSASTYLAGSTGILTTGVGHVRGFDVKMQGLACCIDASQSHSAGTIYTIQMHSLRMEASLVGVRSNQLGTHIYSGTWDSGNLSAGLSGTIAFDMLAGAEFEVLGFAVGGVETPIQVAAGAAGIFETPTVGRQVWGTKLRGTTGGKYMGTATTVAGSTGGVPTVTAGSQAGTGPVLGGSMSPGNLGLDTGSTDMSGRVVITTGTTPASGTQATVTFATAFPAGTKPIIWVARETSGSNITINAIAIDNTKFIINSNSAPAASTVYVYEYAILGFTS